MAIAAVGAKVLAVCFVIVGAVLTVIGIVYAEWYRKQLKAISPWIWIMIWVGIILLVVGAAMAVGGSLLSHRSKYRNEKMHIEEVKAMSVSS
jgi:hypothetical protein